MRKSAKQERKEQAIKSKLGKHVEQLIKEAGYSGPYDFWINTAGGENEVSRDTLEQNHQREQQRKCCDPC